MLQKPSTCAGCVLFDRGLGYAPASGPVQAELAIVGEALGRSEALAGQPFVGPSGELLNRLLTKVGLDRAAVRVDNCVRCQPPNDWLDGAPWEHQALATCRQYLDKTLGEGRRAVVALGGSATRQLLGLPRKGHKQQNWHGQPVLEPHGRFWVVPSFHPAYLLRGNKKLSGVVCWDLKQAIEVAGGRDPRPAPTSLVVDPSPSWFEQWATRITEDCWLAVDIETQDKILGQAEDELADDFGEIIRINFAYHPDQGVTVPWSGQYLAIIRRLLGHQGVQCYWNASYDIPRLRAAGFASTGRVLDFMWAWHVLQSDLPRGLGFVAPFYSDYGPWKHLSGTDPGRYAAVDAVQTLRCAFGITRDLQAGGQWEAFQRHVYCLDSQVLKPAEDAGLGVDKAGLAAYRQELASEKLVLVAKAQNLVDEALKPLGPSLARRPAGEAGIVEKLELVEIQLCLTCREVNVTKTHRCKDEKGKISKELKPKVVKESQQTSRYHRQLPFNLGSPDQLLNYIKHKRHKPGRAKKTARDSTDEQTLARLAKTTKDPLYPLVLDYRRVDKVLGTYVEGTERRLGADGRLHPTFTHGPSTMRLSCVNPNLQNVDKESKFRRALVAGPGMVLLEVDFSAIEAVETGWFLGDPDFVRLAKLGIHDYHAGHVLGERVDAGWGDDELRQALKAIKARAGAQRDKSKRTIYGCLSGAHEVLTPQGWVRLDQLQTGTQVAQWSNGAIEFVVPSRITNRDWQGEMIRLEGRGLSATMTPWHRLATITNNVLVERTADTLKKHDRIPINGILQGPVEDGVYPQLAAAIQADGHLSRKKVRFCLKRSRKKKRLELLLQTCHADFTKREYPDYPGRTYYRISKASIPRALAYLAEPDKTFVLDKLLVLTASQKRALVDETTFWDGHRHGKQSWYMTTNKSNAEAIQTLAHLAGIQALLQMHLREGKRLPLYKLSFNKRKLARVCCLIKTLVPWDGPVYCVTVPSSYFLTRHRNRISVTGNTLYGMTALGLHKTYPELFPTVASAEANQKLLFELCPKLPAWHQALRDRAWKMGYLGGADHPFHYKHWFWEVYQWDGQRGEWTLGADAKSCIAYYPQSTAAGVLYESCLELTDLDMENCILQEGQVTPFRALVHDSVLLEIYKSEVDKVLAKVVNAMTRPIEEQPMVGELAKLGTHLQIGVAAKLGANWGEMEEIAC